MQRRFIDRKEKYHLVKTEEQMERYRELIRRWHHIESVILEWYSDGDIQKEMLDIEGNNEIQDLVKVFAVDRNKYSGHSKKFFEKGMLVKALSHASAMKSVIDNSWDKMVKWRDELISVEHKKNSWKKMILMSIMILKSDQTLILEDTPKSIIDIWR